MPRAERISTYSGILGGFQVDTVNISTIELVKDIKDVKGKARARELERIGRVRGGGGGEKESQREREREEKEIKREKMKELLEADSVRSPYPPPQTCCKSCPTLLPAPPRSPPPTAVVKGSMPASQRVILGESRQRSDQSEDKPGTLASLHARNGINRVCNGQWSMMHDANTISHDVFTMTG